MEDINLHFTGDMHAIGAANNLLAAMIDNHVYWGNKLDLDVRRITWRRAVDMNDRSLRSMVSSVGGVGNGFPREAGFDITVASEIMAILCLCSDADDLQRRLGNIVIGYTRGPSADHRQPARGPWRHVGAAQGRPDAEPGADPGEQPRLRPRRPVSPTSPMAATR